MISLAGTPKRRSSRSVNATDRGGGTLGVSADFWEGLNSTLGVELICSAHDGRDEIDVIDVTDVVAGPFESSSQVGRLMTGSGAGAGLAVTGGKGLLPSRRTHH